MHEGADNKASTLMNATSVELERAAGENHRQLFSLNAKILDGDVIEKEGITYTRTTYGANVLFPEFKDIDFRIHVDEMMAYFRQHDVKHVGFWALDRALPVHLDAYLLASGFQAGWKPCWMAADISAYESADDRTKNPRLSESTREQPALENISIRPDNRLSLMQVPDLPYKEEGGAFSDNLLKKEPERAQRFVAFSGNTIVGQCCIFFSEGLYGIGGLYNVGVVPSMRRKGIAKQLVFAACQFAREKGYKYVMLNANSMGKPVYEQVGFKVVSYGLTWWITDVQTISTPANALTVKLAEAAIIGDIPALDALLQIATTKDLNEKISNGKTLAQLAAECNQKEAAALLIANGAACTALDAWDLGWMDRTETILKSDPNEINRRYYNWGGTLMHIAAERNDLALARLATDYNADPGIQDLQHNSSPLGWALYFERQEIAAIYKSYADHRR